MNFTEIMPGKVDLHEGICLVPFGLEEYSFEDFEVLVTNNVDWVEASNGDIPPNAVVGGETCTGEKTYIGRAKLETGELILAKLQPSLKCIFILSHGVETSCATYEVLVFDNPTDGILVKRFQPKNQLLSDLF